MNSDTEIDYLLKLVIIGDTGVGKTNLLSRFVSDDFDENVRNTIGVDFSAIDVQINGKNIKAQLWDTAGQEKYKAIASAYYKNAQGAVIVYDITQRETFESVSNWFTELKEHSDPDIPVIILGNKVDLVSQRQVLTDEAKKYAEAKGIFFMETSGKVNDDKAVNKAFMLLLETIVERLELEDNRNADDDAVSFNSKNDALNKKSDMAEDKKGCC